MELIDKTTYFLKQKDVASPRLQIELLLAHVLQLPRMTLYLQFDRELSQAELDALRPLVKRRAEHEPLQHILGETDFYGLDFHCDPSALIPRPETEILVEWVIAVCQSQPNGKLMDIGTGSGIIALTLAKHLPAWQITGVDISPAALALARKNQQRLALNNVTWVEHDLLPPVTEKHVVVANLPYLTDAEMTTLAPEVRFDPELALRGGKDGLDLIRRLIGQLGPDITHLFLESGGNHDAILSNLLAAAGFSQIEVRADLNNIPRFIMGIRH